MMNIRSVHAAFLFTPLAVSAAALSVLFAFPSSLLVWQICAWSLVFAALLLVVVLPVTAYSLARNPSARTWPRRIAFVLGVAYTAVLAFGSMSS